ncbi:CoxG family protein [Hydrogenophaga sp. XSHU_21]
MDMQGSRTLPVTQQQAWDALNDADVLKSCVPGCDRFEPLGDDAYAVGAGIKVGPVSAKFSGRVQLSDIVAPERYRLTFEAQGGVAGFGKGESSVRLMPAGPHCELHYTVSSTVGGKIAQLGQRLIDGAAKSMADDFFRRFEEELRRRHPEAALAAPTTTGAAVPSGPWPVWVWSTIAFSTTFLIALVIFFMAAWT